MPSTLFTDGWTVSAEHSAPVPVTLPHDAMISEERHPEAPSGAHGSYFPGGRYRYAKRWVTPSGAQRDLRLFFEGVQGESRVLVDGEQIGENISGYREFEVPLPKLTPGEEHLIEVDVDASRQPAGRWYSGAGIYRRVWLEEVPALHLPRDGVRLRTLSAGASAVVEAVVELPGAANGSEVQLRISDDGRPVACASAEVGEGCTTLTVVVPAARLWSDVSPHLYDVDIDLVTSTGVVDQRRIRYGIRTVEVDATSGLRINGRTTLLRGGCIHHDSGPLGAATFRSAEYRRARILKEQGYNALRSAHNPMSRDLLDACDELGIYVVDELTDVWFSSKTAFDLAPRFEELWPEDLRSMVAKDRNHPCVIMYSIGNENAETSSPRGVEAAGQITSTLRALDPDRPVTTAVNFLLNLMASRGGQAQTAAPSAAPDARRRSAVTSTAANIVADRLGSIMQLVARAPGADKATRDVFAEVDVASYNYAWGRYPGDARRHPRRVVLGSESLPGDIARLWPVVERLPNVIGDFSWTAWDHLGEAGIGTWAYGAEAATAALAKPYPHLLGGTGAIDVTGHPGAPTFLARAAWGLLQAPAIAVRPLDRSGQKVRRTAWRSTDAIASWSWAGAEGRRADVEVYSADDEVELLVNGRSMGRRRCGVRKRFVAGYRLPYEPGEVVAVGYRHGRERGRTSLRSAGAPRLRLVAECDDQLADGQELGFVRIEVADANGTVEMLRDDHVTIEVTGPAVLAALGSARPATVDPLTGPTCSTYYGRALAVVRSDGTPGNVVVRASSPRLGTAVVNLAFHAAGERLLVR